MSKQNIKEEFAKVILNAKITAAIFVVLITPSIVIAVKDLEEIYGIGKDSWLIAAVAGFLIYGSFTYIFWKCPKCKEFPGRGWFRKNCDKCGVELS